jgi:hemerythrin-like domain-containing protein
MPQTRQTCYERGMRPLLQPVAPRIDDPIDLLLACHDKVRRFAGLCLRLRDHIQEAGADQEAQEAAHAILRYFEVAAPLHHDDEEQDLFPALRALNRPALGTCLDELAAEHRTLGALWQPVRLWLQAVAHAQAATPPASLHAFAQAYMNHAQREEDEVYPAASQLLPEQIKAISAAMVARRTVA